MGELTVQGFPASRGAYIPKTVQAQQNLLAWRTAHTEAPDAWLRAIICEAFRRMSARRMQDAPAADVIHTVAEDWIDIVGTGMTEELDSCRIIHGFQQLFRECRRWPQPVDLLKRLPRRVTPQQPGTMTVQAVDETANERSAKALDDIINMLNKD
jgi:hypothetical protein